MHNICKKYIFIILLVLSFLSACSSAGNNNDKMVKKFTRFTDSLLRNNYSEAQQLLTDIVKQGNFHNDDIQQVESRNTQFLRYYSQKIHGFLGKQLRENLDRFLPDTKADIHNLNTYELKYLRDTLILQELSQNICKNADTDIECLIPPKMTAKSHSK